jgi:hypothetical protein
MTSPLLPRPACLAAAVLAVITISPVVNPECLAGTQIAPISSSVTLLTMAMAVFPGLTHAEIALLTHADLQSRATADFASGGTSADPADRSNDPSSADEWPHERSVRAELIRWMCVDPRAVVLIDPRGIRLTGARINGKLDLSHVRMPFGIALVRCSLPEILDLTSTDVLTLDFNGSRTNRINAEQVHVRGDASFGWDNHWWGTPFEPSGEIDLADSQVDGSAVFGTGIFQSSKNPAYTLSAEAAIDLSQASVSNGVELCCGMVAHGMVDLDRIKVGGPINLAGAHFLNPRGVAISGTGAKTEDGIYMAALPFYGDFQAEGMVQFPAAHVAGLLWVDHAHFKGSSGAPHGLLLNGASMRILSWQHIQIENDGVLDLRGASAETIVDDEPSWPMHSKLLLDSLTYKAVGPISDATTRLRWLNRQPPGFHPQPYRELVNMLRYAGDETGAIRVLVAAEDSRYAQFGRVGAIWGWFLKWTIGYGHRPLLTLLWAALIMIIGYVLVRLASGAGVMRPTYPENHPADDSRYEVLHPLLYSLDVFLPFVDLHQEHYWWPDERAAGDVNLIGITFSVRGRFVLMYLWTQIVLGWLLSAIFVAGVTGLLRND